MSGSTRERNASDCALVQRDAAVFLHQAGSSPVARAITAAEGARFRDSAGHWVYDLHGNGCHHLGYGHPRLVAAAERQIHTLPFAPRRYTNPQAVALAEALVRRWPGGAGRVLFAPSGSDAIDIALKLARLATGRPGTIAFEGSWHGAGMGPLAVGGRASERPRRLGPLPGPCWHVPGYDPWADGDVLHRSAASSVDAVAGVLAAHPEIGCMLAEPVLAGPALAPPGYWPRIRALCDAHGVLLVFDEIPRGLGRTGRLFASEHTGVRPDMTVLGKALGGALVPLAAVIARSDLNVAADLAIGHFTHEKSALGSAIGLEVLAVLEQEHLVARAGAIGARFAAAIAADAGQGRPITRVGAIGAMVALAFQDRRPETTASRIEALYREGVNLTAGAGRAVLMPPLVMTDSQIEDVATRILRGVASG